MSLTTWCVLLASLLATLSGAQAEPPPRTPAERPNIVFFLVDDLGWQDTSVPMTPEPTALNKRWRTPNLEQLAARGMKFTNAYSAAPVCTPSRTAILTGRSPGQTHITYWTLMKDKDTSAPYPTLLPPKWNVNGLSPGDVTLASLLHDAGYRTIHAGKWHVAAVGTPGEDPRTLGFDVNIAGHGAGAPSSYYGTHRFSEAGRKGDPDAKPSVWDVPGLDQYHAKDIFLEEALAEQACLHIRRAAQDGRPFFLYFATYAVHAPIMSNRRYLDEYPDLDTTEAAYGTMIETVDAALGSIVRTIDDLGLAGRTVIVFTSDNGGLSAHARGKAPDGSAAHHHNAPLRSGKGSAYEGGVRVPAVVCWPGVTPPASSCATPVIGHDWFPTLLSAAGVEVPAAHRAKVEGRDLSPLLRAVPGFDADRALFWNQPHFWGVKGPGIEPFTSVRAGDWKLIYFHDGPRFELYNLAKDLGEEHDHSADQPARVEALARAMQAWIEQVGAQVSIEKASNRPVPLPGAAVKLNGAR